MVNDDRKDWHRVARGGCWTRKDQALSARGGCLRHQNAFTGLVSFSLILRLKPVRDPSRVSEVVRQATLV